MSKKNFFRGTFILTCTGIVSRIIGFFYRIFLSHSIGAQGVGLFQLVLPVQNLVMALTASGIQTALSRLVASRMALGKKKEAKDVFRLGTASAFFLALAASVILYKNSSFIAAELLKAPQTAPLLRILVFSFPLSALHSCISSYYFAGKQAEIPSALQLLEQIVRVCSSYVIYLVSLSKNIPVTASIAAGGALASEVAAALAGLLIIGTKFSGTKDSVLRIKNPLTILREIFCTSLPLTLNRLLLTLLGSIEVVLIPQRLQASGLSSAEALSVYGVFTGMVLPFILFPSALTNSASVMLMPSVAEMQALGCRKRIRRITAQSCTGCLLLGTVCALGFLLLGPLAGKILFHSPTAGTYIRTMAFICPFLYMNTALTSVLHGLGKTGTCLFHNASGILLRISFVLFAVPLMGIRGYMYGLLLSEILVSILHIFALYHCEQ